MSLAATAGTTASNLESRDWISVPRHDGLGGLDEDRVAVFRCGDAFGGLRTKSLPEEGEAISRETIVVLTTSAKAIEKEHLL